MRGNKRLLLVATVLVGGLVGMAATRPVSPPTYTAVIVNRVSHGSQSGQYSEAERVTATLNQLAERGLTSFSMTALSEDRVLIVAREMR